MSGVATVVRIQQTKEGWKPVKRTPVTQAVPLSQPDTRGIALPVEVESVVKKARVGTEAKVASTGTEEGAATAVEAPAVAPRQAPRGLIAMAKRRTFVEVEEEEEASTGIPLGRKGSSNQETGASASTLKTKTRSLVALAKKKEEEQWDEWELEEYYESKPRGSSKSAAKDTATPRKGSFGKGAPRDQGKGSAKGRGKAAPINQNISYSGVVKKRDRSTGNFIIECGAVTSALGQPAAISEENDPGGVKIGSIVCFKVEPAGRGSQPLATNIVINGFDEDVAG